MYREWSSMNPMMYAIFPRMEKYVISLCHIWFGVERSNRRSGCSRGFRAFALGVASPAFLSSRLTVPGLALMKKIRRRICDSRLPPCRGFSRFSAAIFSFTAGGSLFTDRLL